MRSTLRTSAPLTNSIHQSQINRYTIIILYIYTPREREQIHTFLTIHAFTHTLLGLRFRRILLSFHLFFIHSLVHSFFFTPFPQLLQLLQLSFPLSLFSQNLIHHFLPPFLYLPICTFFPHMLPRFLSSFA